MSRQRVKKHNIGVGLNEIVLMGFDVIGFDLSVGIDFDELKKLIIGETEIYIYKEDDKGTLI